MLKIYFYLTVACVMCEAYFSFFKIGFFPARNYILLIAISLIVFESALQRKIRVHKIAIYFLIISLYAIFISGNDIFCDGFIYQFLRINIASIFIFLLTYKVFSDKLEYINKFILVYIILISISSLVAIMQSFHIELGWDLRKLFVDGTMDQTIQALDLGDDRPTGLSYTPVSLGYEIGIAFPLTLYYFRNLNIIKYFLIAILSLGCIASEMRSSLLAIFTMVFVSILLSNKFFLLKVIKIIFIASFVLGIVGLTVSGYSERLFQLDSSALGRFPMIAMGIMYILDNPLGKGVFWYKDYMNYARVNVDWFDFINNSEVLNHLVVYAPHNQIINTFAMYGILIGILYLYVYIKTIKKLHHAFLGGDALSFYLLLCFAGYFVNTFFHNAGPMVGDLMIWYFIGMVFAYLTHLKRSRRMEND